MLDDLTHVKHVPVEYYIGLSSVNNLWVTAEVMKFRLFFCEAIKCNVLVALTD